MQLINRFNYSTTIAVLALLLTPIQSYAASGNFWGGMMDGMNQMSNSLNEAESVRIQRERADRDAQREQGAQRGDQSSDIKYKADMYEMCIGDNKRTNEIERHCVCYATSFTKKISRAELFAAKSDTEKDFIKVVGHDTHQQCDKTAKN